MVGDALDSFEGPRTLRYFASLLMIVVMLFVLGVILSEFYGITLLENLMQGFADNPMRLLNLAGFLAFIVLAVTVARYALKFAE